MSVDFLGGKFTEALGWLDDKYAFFLTAVLSMGDPIADEAISTACVTKDASAKNGFTFHVNPTFASSCSMEELAGVLAHETMHILLNHLGRFNEFPDERKYAIAADLVINDYLDAAALPLPDGVLRGFDIVGFDCSNLELKAVYDAVPDEQEESTCGFTENALKDPADSSDGGTAANASNAMPDADLDKAIKEAISNAVSGKLPDDLKDMLDVDGLFSKGGLSSPGSSFSSVESYAEQSNLSLDWVKLLSEINPDILKKPGGIKPKKLPSYHTPRRKLAGYYPDIMLPVERDAIKNEKKKGSQKPLLVLALDTSGSIPAHMVKTMQQLALSVPQDLIEVACCTFSTQFVSFDINSSRNHIASGGTDFSAVESFVRKIAADKSLSYPKAVVVLTDGEAFFNRLKPSSEQLESSWLWLLTPGGTSRYIKSYTSAAKISPLSSYK